MPDNSVPSIKICLLGRFEVWRGEEVLRSNAWQRRKATALLQRLALEERLLRDEALEFLWPASEPDAAANNLYRTLYSLRQTLDQVLGEGTAGATFSYSDGVLRLADGVCVDAHTFEELCRQKSLTTAQLQEAIAIYEGPLLPESAYDDWSAAPRQTLHRLYRDTCLRLAGQVTEAREIEIAAAHLRPFLEEDPADEDVHRQLMQLFARLGRRHEALRQYQECVKALDEQLGVPPTAETRALHEAIVRGEMPTHSAGLRARSPNEELPRPAAMPLAVAQVHGQTPLAGRHAELERLRALLDAVAGGEGGTLLIEGATGVGKTRLARTFLQMASSKGMRVLSGAAYEYEGHLAYQPFAEAIDHYLSQAEAESLQNPITHFIPQDGGDLQQAKWALFSNTATFFARLGAEAPIILFVDDLHAADEATLQLFHYLARHTRSRPFLLAATYRTDIVREPASPFGALLNALYRERLRETIALEPLEGGDIAAIVRHLLDGDVDRPLIDLVAEATEGNPFFAEEMCRALLHSGHIVQDEGVWRVKTGHMPAIPGDLGQLLRQRIAQCGAATVSALEVAAVIGRTFNLQVLRRVAILDDVDLVDALDAASQAGFIEDAGSGYRFRHGLIRRALQQTQSRPRLQRLHALIATAIEGAFERGEESSGEHVEALAYHYERSDRPKQALPYLLHAGQRAADLYAFEAAVDYYERALALMDDRALGDNARRWRLLESLGWWEKVLANTPKAVAYFEQALSLKATAQWQPAPNERARLHAGAAMALLTVGDTGAAEPHLSAAQELIGEEDYASEYADVLYNVAQLHWHRNEYQQAFEAAQRSLNIAEKLDEAMAVARAFEMLALACHSLGEWQLGLDFEEKRSAIAGPELDVSDAFDAHL